MTARADARLGDGRQHAVRAARARGGVGQAPGVERAAPSRHARRDAAPEAREDCRSGVVVVVGLLKRVAFFDGVAERRRAERPHQGRRLPRRARGGDCVRDAETEARGVPGLLDALAQRVEGSSTPQAVEIRGFELPVAVERPAAVPAGVETRLSAVRAPYLRILAALECWCRPLEVDSKISSNG